MNDEIGEGSAVFSVLIASLVLAFYIAVGQEATKLSSCDPAKTCYQRAVNTTTISIVLRHIIPALTAIQRDLLDAEMRGAVPQPKSEPTPREGSSEPTRFYKVKEAAAFLNVSEGLIRKLTGSKQLPFYKFGSRVMFSEEQLLSWVAGFQHLAEEPSPRSIRRN
jgi:excisionase family DNA binding protein